MILSLLALCYLLTLAHMLWTGRGVLIPNRPYTQRDYFLLPFNPVGYWRRVLDNRKQ